MLLRIVEKLRWTRDQRLPSAKSGRPFDGARLVRFASRFPGLAPRGALLESKAYKPRVIPPGICTKAHWHPHLMPEKTDPPLK